MRSTIEETISGADASGTWQNRRRDTGKGGQDKIIEIIGSDWPDKKQLITFSTHKRLLGQPANEWMPDLSSTPGTVIYEMHK
jgi:hypothetical protein